MFCKGTNYYICFYVGSKLGKPSCNPGVIILWQEFSWYNVQAGQLRCCPMGPRSYLRYHPPAVNQYLGIASLLKRNRALDRQYSVLPILATLSCGTIAELLTPTGQTFVERLLVNEFLLFSFYLPIVFLRRQSILFITIIFNFFIYIVLTNLYFIF